MSTITTDDLSQFVRFLDHNLFCVKSVKTGKLFWVELEADSQPEARKIAGELSDKLLANPIIENFEVRIE